MGGKEEKVDSLCPSRQGIAIPASPEAEVPPSLIPISYGMHSNAASAGKGLQGVEHQSPPSGRPRADPACRRVAAPAPTGLHSFKMRTRREAADSADARQGEATPLSP